MGGARFREYLVILSCTWLLGRGFSELHGGLGPSCKRLKDDLKTLWPLALFCISSTRMQNQGQCVYFLDLTFIVLWISLTWMEWELVGAKHFWMQSICTGTITFIMSLAGISSVPLPASPSMVLMHQTWHSFDSFSHNHLCTSFSRLSVFGVISKTSLWSYPRPHLIQLSP